jgi:hypothetical protein
MDVKNCLIKTEIVYINLKRQNHLGSCCWDILELLALLLALTQCLMSRLPKTGEQGLCFTSRFHFGTLSSCFSTALAAAPSRNFVITNR